MLRALFQRSAVPCSISLARALSKQHPRAAHTTGLGPRPAEAQAFNFHVVAHNYSDYLARLQRHWDVAGLFRDSENNDYASFITGPMSFGKTKVYVEEFDSTVRMWFRDREAFNAFDAEMNAKEDSTPNSVYRFDYEREIWVSEHSYQPRSPENLVGCEHILSTIRANFKNYQKHQEILQKLDENKPLNILLYGPPGCGKSSLIMTLASLESLPIYIVNANGLQFRNLQAALSPRRRSCETGMRIVLFEDFDRFLEHQDIGVVLSQILNALDGVDNTDSRTVRFFTGNNCDVIFGTPAMINRMSSRFSFSPPTREMLEERLNQVLHACGHPSLEKDSALLDRAVKCGINMRQWAAFALRFAFDQQPVVQMLEHIDQLDKRASS